MTSPTCFCADGITGSPEEISGFTRPLTSVKLKFTVEIADLCLSKDQFPIYCLPTVRWMFSSAAQVRSNKFHFNFKGTISFPQPPLPLPRGSRNAIDLNTAEKPLKPTEKQEGGHNKWASAKFGHVTRGERRG